MNWQSVRLWTNTVYQELALLVKEFTGHQNASYAFLWVAPYPFLAKYASLAKNFAI